MAQSDALILQTIIPYKLPSEFRENNDGVFYLEKMAIKTAETNLPLALEIINKAIDENPQNASLFNNRAQIYQLMQRHEDDVMSDLNIAVELNQGDENFVASQIYTQRGILHQKLNDINAAKNDYTKAAKMGSIFAQNQLLQMNPYSALCNQMLKEINFIS